MDARDQAVWNAVENFYDDDNSLPAINTDILPGSMVIACLNQDGHPMLKILSWEDARAWYRRAQAYLADPANKEENLYWAMVETEKR